MITSKNWAEALTTVRSLQGINCPGSEVLEPKISISRFYFIFQGSKKYLLLMEDKNQVSDDRKMRPKGFMSGLSGKK